MKLLICLVGIGIITFTVYSFLSFYSRKSKKQRQRKISRKIIGITMFIGMFLFGFVVFAMYRSATAPDTQCSTYHVATIQPPTNAVTAKDYFLLGDYDYDTGNCTLAITHYTKSIALDPTYPQAYNNRAYTYMRMRQYDKALPDLDEAISLNPLYIQALMNRGDIYNYYVIDKKSAIADYQRVIAFGGTEGTSVCGHLFLARHNGWNVGTFLSMPWELFSMRNCK